MLSLSREPPETIPVPEITILLGTDSLYSSHFLGYSPNIPHFIVSVAAVPYSYKPTNLSQTNPVHALTFNFFSIHFDVNRIYAPSKKSLCFKISRKKKKTLFMWAGIAQSVQHIATGWTVRASNSGWGETFRTEGRSGPISGLSLSLKGKATSAWGLTTHLHLLTRLKKE